MNNIKSAMRLMNSSKNKLNIKKTGFLSNVKHTLSYLLFLYGREWKVVVCEKEKQL